MDADNKQSVVDNKPLVVDNTVIEVEDIKLPIEVCGLTVTGFFQLGDGRMEVLWEPKDMEIPEEIEYLAKKAGMEIAQTLLQSRMKNDPVEYLFTPDVLLRGLRCPKQVFQLFMMARKVEDKVIDGLLALYAKSPIKTLVDKDLVNEVAARRPWETQPKPPEAPKE